jgi:hypothetical protein
VTSYRTTAPRASRGREIVRTDRTNAPEADRPDISSDSGDPRAKAFAQYLAAYDGRDHKKLVEVTRELRALGFSVCLVTPRHEMGGR